MEPSVSVAGIQSMQLSAAAWLALSQQASLASFVRVPKYPGVGRGGGGGWKRGNVGGPASKERGKKGGKEGKVPNKQN